MVDPFQMCAQSKLRPGVPLESCEPFPVPSYPFTVVAMDFVSLPEVNHPRFKPWCLQFF